MSNSYMTQKEITEKLDQMKLDIALAVVAQHPMAVVRERSLKQLDEWKARATDSKLFDEWTFIMRKADDARLMTVMTGEGIHYRQLRNVQPYVTLLGSAELAVIRRKYYG